MDKFDILNKCDHTLLSQTATWDEIKKICDDGMHYHTASLCIPPSYVKKAKEYVKDNIKICTVIGFPNGYNTINVKVYEAKEAIENGASEIDMVINIGLLKDKKYDEVENEIKELKKVCGDKVLKVIIETCLLTDDEKKKMCEIVTSAGADFIKTSTGFSKAGATFDDIKLFAENVGKDVKIKAAGGISTIDDAKKFVELGADRLGTSRVVKILKKRAFLIVLDSMGIGEMPDASKWHDEGSNTLGAIRKSKLFDCPNLKKLGLFDIENVGGGTGSFDGAVARMNEASAGKDTTIGHWEIAGITSKEPLPTYENGFPKEVIDEFEKQTGRKILCNKPYSGTEVIKDYGEEHIKTGSLIVYTSADSVFQIAAHEDYVSVNDLYKYCEIARNILKGKHGVGRVIARPFNGTYPFTRTSNRHDYSLNPPSETMLDLLKESLFDVVSVGKIYDIFAGMGITESTRTKDNADGMRVASEIVKKDFSGLCFVNLVDFDMKYGHRNDIDGYANAMTEFDKWLPNFMKEMRDDDILIITADHGCDPSTPSTDHSREYTPMIMTGKKIKSNVNLGTRKTFADISATILDYFSVDKKMTSGESFLQMVVK